VRIVPKGGVERVGYGQLCPQIDPTSPTQMLSHAVEQQYESEKHTCIAHGSQEPFSAPPDEQMA
jgi:hypothetical protein